MPYSDSASRNVPRRFRGRSTCGYLTFAAAALIATRARAASTDFDMSYVAPAGCPAAGDVEAAILERAPHAARVAASDRVVVIRIEPPRPNEASYRGEVQLVVRGESTMSRTVSGSTCSDVTSALALIVAMSIEEGQPDEAQDGGDAPTTAAAEASSVEPTTQVVDHAPKPLDMPEAEDARSRRPRRPSARAGWQSSFLLGGGIATGVVDDVAPLAAIAYEGRLTRGNSFFAPALQVGVAYVSGTEGFHGPPPYTPRAIVVRGGAFTLDACPLRFQGGIFAARPCAALEIGGRVAEASPDHAGSRGFPWLGIGGKVILDFAVTRMYFIQLEGAALAPIIDRWIFAGEGLLVFRSPPVAFRSRLGLGVSFP
jgi:hypothetical protein